MVDEKNNNHDEKKEMILNWIKEFKRLSTSRFVGLLGSSYEVVKKLLEELEQEQKIIKEEETNSTYWRLKEENGV